MGLTFATASPDIDESPLPGEAPDRQARRLAEYKCRTLQRDYPDHIIIGADQVAVLDGRRLTKPGSRSGAIRQLRAESGRSVVFYTAVSLLDAVNGQMATEVDRCAVQFRRLRQAQIENYVGRDRPFDCAGAFKSESLGIALFERFDGADPNALVGLPLIRLIGLLERFGVAVI